MAVYYRGIKKLLLSSSKLLSNSQNVFETFLFNSKFVIATKNEFWVHIFHIVKIKTSRDPTCDVLCISSIIQDGGPFIAFRKIFQESSKI